MKNLLVLCYIDYDILEIIYHVGCMIAVSLGSS